MLRFVKSAGRWLYIGWFWTGIVLVLPNCMLDTSGLAVPTNFNPGPSPRTGAIFCDIEKASGRHCATEMEKTIGIRLSDAALALNDGRTSSIGLDYSADALSHCGGEPEAVEFEGPFPEGKAVCLNCGTVLGPEMDPITACRQTCYDFYGTSLADRTWAPNVPPVDEVRTFCDAHAQLSTNQLVDSCSDGACTDTGTLRADFLDPRREQEPVVWTDFIGTEAGASDASDLVRTAAFTTNFDAGAVSTQWVTRGDAYLEFSGTSADEGRIAGFAPIPPGCPAPCPDTDPTELDTGFAIGLGPDGRVYVFENGVRVLTGPDLNGSFGTYVADERFRVKLQDNGDNTVTVSYSRLLGSCSPGSACAEDVFYTSAAFSPTYPLRVDATIREPGATVTKARLVRIQ